MEILWTYGFRFFFRLPELGTQVQGSSTGIGGTGIDTTGSGNPGDRSEDVRLSDVMRGMLQLQKAVSLIDGQMKELLAGRKGE